MRLNSVLKALSLFLESEEGHGTRFRDPAPADDWPRQSCPEAAVGKSSDVAAAGFSKLDGSGRSTNGGLGESKPACREG